MKLTIDELIKEMKEEYDAYLEVVGFDDDPSYMKEMRKQNPGCDLVCTANEMTLTILKRYNKILEVIDESDVSERSYTRLVKIYNIVRGIEDESNN